MDYGDTFRNKWFWTLVIIHTILNVIATVNQYGNFYFAEAVGNFVGAFLIWTITWFVIIFFAKMFKKTKTR